LVLVFLPVVISSSCDASLLAVDIYMQRVQAGKRSKETGRPMIFVCTTKSTEPITKPNKPGRHCGRKAQDMIGDYVATPWISSNSNTYSLFNVNS